MAKANLDAQTVEGFGFEWKKFNQQEMSVEEHERLFDAYFSIFPWGELPAKAEGFDLGCGSGRWAKGAATRVGKLHCIDASQAALEVARENLSGLKNCVLHHASVDQIPLQDNSMDFGYSLGVLHHVPNTLAGLQACVRKLKPGAPFLLYLYYSLDNRPWWFRSIWWTTNEMRKKVSQLPERPRYLFSQMIAASMYWPMARASFLLENLGLSTENLPLSFYRDKSFYVMRNDALDRFGTKLEQRFSREQVKQMMGRAGLQDIRFREMAPFWTAVGKRS